MTISSFFLRLSRTWNKVIKVGPQGVLRACLLLHRPFTFLSLYLELVPFQRAIVLQTCNGFAIPLESGDDLATFWSCWIKQEYPVTGREGCIVDAGANIGSFSLFAAFRNPKARIVALEPVAGTFKRLSQNLAANQLAGKVEIWQKGLAGDSGTRSISMGDSSPYASMFQKVGETTESIQTLSLKDLVVEMGHPKEIDILKMDCEGAEMECLLAADTETLMHFRAILIEFHEFSGIAIQDLNAHLTKSGFSILKFQRNLPYPVGLAWYSRN